MADPGNRYHHLLQPLRDLSKVWNIEIAEELEKYLEEVSSLSFQDGGASKLNFAEAALLIQGSTAIYSRKVEQLYALVYQALGQLMTDKEGGVYVDAQGRKKVPTGLWAPIPETDELLTIDHLIKEGRNITLDDAALQRQEQRQALHRRVPLFLMPRDRSDGKQEFRIGNCTVHRSGAYLIQESDAQLLEKLLAREGHEQCSPLAPPPPSAVKNLDDQLQVLLRGLPGSGSGLEASPEPADASFDFEAHAGFEAAPDLPDIGGSPLLNLIRGPRLGDPDSLPGDPWALLDEDAQVGQDTPAVVEKCTRRFGTKGLLSKGDGLPQRGTWEPLSDADLWRPGHAADGMGEFLATGHPVNSLFRVVGTQLRNGGRTETARIGLSAAWLEFEDLFQAASSKRRRLMANSREKAKLAGAMDLGDALDVADAEDMAAPMTPPRTFGADEELGMQTPARGSPGLQVTPFGGDLGDMNEEPLSQADEQRQQVAKLEGLIEDAQSQYETSVRSKLQSIQGGAENQQTYPELYENVRRWQEQLGPVLKEFESHPEFDINIYGSKIIGKMVAVENGDEEESSGKAVPFSRLVYGQPRWEVCRRFLTCLLLTNHGNTEIVCDNDDERTNGFSVKLLQAEVKHLSLYDEDEEEPRAMAPRAAAPLMSPCADLVDVPRHLRRASTPSREDLIRVSTPLRRKRLRPDDEDAP